MSQRAQFRIFLCSMCCHFQSVRLIFLWIIINNLRFWWLFRAIMWWCKCPCFPESYTCMKTLFYLTLQGPLCLNWGVLLALFWSLFLVSMKPALIFYFLPRSRPWSDVKQHFDAVEDVMGQWVIPSEVKSAKNRICRLLSCRTLTYRLLKHNNLTPWNATCTDNVLGFKYNTYENAWFICKNGWIQKEIKQKVKVQISHAEGFMYVGYMYRFVFVGQLQCSSENK